jgi:hypothetical protein
MATNRLPSAPRTSSSESWHKDEVVEELHRHRAELAARFDYDLKRLYEYYASVPISPRMQRAEISLVKPKRPLTTEATKEE